MYAPTHSCFLLTSRRLLLCKSHLPLSRPRVVHGNSQIGGQQAILGRLPSAPVVIDHTSLTLTLAYA